MCGITAVVSLGQRPHRPAASASVNGTNGNHDTNETSLEKEIDESLDRISHRGPDARGMWIEKQGKVALGHCRLSIVDLSTDGNQPFHSPDNTVHCVVNGEIYEFERIREELVREFGYEFKSHSDSEVVVALYKNYGLSFLSHMRGEFALCLYDETRELFIAARDRYGIKPLFWTVVDGRLLVASEMKAFLPLGWKPEWDVRSIFDAGWVADARTTFKGVQKVRPGQYLILTSFQTMEMRQYWDTEYRDKNEVETRTEAEMIAGVREKLVNAIRLRLRADVPVGIYLSGGLDSSAVAGIVTHLVKEEGTKAGTQDIKDKVCTFSVAFDEDSGFDESPIAARTAEHLGIKNIKKVMNEEQLANYFEDATYHCEHSNFDLNYIGKFALSEVTRDNGYKVVLTGEGADELFGGYIPFVSEYLREPDRAWPHGILHADDKIRQELQGPRVAASLAWFKSFGSAGTDGLSDTVARQLNGMDITSGFLIFRPPVTSFSSWVQSIYHNLNPRDTVTDNVDGRVKELILKKWHPLHSALYVWIKAGLVNNLLSCLGDRVEMGHSVEARTPFLDHHLAEYVNGLPPSVKVRCVVDDPEAVKASKDGKEVNASKAYGLTEKWILREATRPFITDEIYDRRKHPYTAPATYLAGGPLHTLVQKTLTEENVKGLGFLDWEVVKSNLQEAFPKEAGQGIISSHVLRSVFMSTQLVMLGKRFGVEKAAPDIRV